MRLPVERSVNKNVWTLKNQFHMELWLNKRSPNASLCAGADAHPCIVEQHINMMVVLLHWAMRKSNLFLKKDMWFIWPKWPDPKGESAHGAGTTWRETCFYYQKHEDIKITVRTGLPVLQLPWLTSEASAGLAHVQFPSEHKDGPYGKARHGRAHLWWKHP